jgi:predicted GNAT family N-acyltransferase
MQRPRSADSNHQLQLVTYGSEAYHQAAQIRYHLFYQEHNISFESIFDAQEEQALHLSVIERISDRVLAYGQIRQNSPDEFQIHQMVVLPEFQGQGLGTQILQGLIAAAIERGARLLLLNARVAKAQFYQKFGFEPLGDVFPSSMTGVPHIKMQKQIAG